MYNLYSSSIIILMICSSKESVLVLPQIATQVLALDPASIRCKPRAWKVHLVGEGADDAGGVFDETIAQMCEVYHLLRITITLLSLI